MKFLFTSLILTGALIEERQELLRITGREARVELLTGTVTPIVKLLEEIQIGKLIEILQHKIGHIRIVATNKQKGNKSLIGMIKEWKDSKCLIRIDNGWKDSSYQIKIVNE